VRHGATSLQPARFNAEVVHWLRTCKCAMSSRDRARE
jgi:hypothetical protein